MNAGVADAMDLSWLLAAHLNNQARATGGANWPTPKGGNRIEPYKNGTASNRSRPAFNR